MESVFSRLTACRALRSAPGPGDREPLVDLSRLHAVEHVQASRGELVAGQRHDAREVDVDAPVGGDEDAFPVLERRDQRLVARYRRGAPQLLELRSQEEPLDGFLDVPVHAGPEDRAEPAELALERLLVDLRQQRVGDLGGDGRDDRPVRGERRDRVDISVLD